MSLRVINLAFSSDLKCNICSHDGGERKERIFQPDLILDVEWKKETKTKWISWKINLSWMVEQNKSEKKGRRPVSTSARRAVSWRTVTATTVKRERGVAPRWPTGDRDVDVGKHTHTRLRHKSPNRQPWPRVVARRQPWRACGLGSGAKMDPEHLSHGSAPQVVQRFPPQLLTEVRGRGRSRARKKEHQGLN